jgi:hypothetical protein
MGMPDSLGAMRQQPYRNIFYAIVTLFFVDALLSDRFARAALGDVIVVFVLFAALFETVRSRRHAAIALVLGAPAILSRLVAAFRADSIGWNNVVLTSTALFIGFLIWNLLRDLLVGDRSTGERVYGALCAYLFIGILFSLLFTHMEFRSPGSFLLHGRAISGASESEAELLPTFTYYSFVTLTTLGYGDIAPATTHARTLAWLEALVGQLYLAVMVATLVGIRVSEGLRAGAGCGPPPPEKESPADS